MFVCLFIRICLLSIVSDAMVAIWIVCILTIVGCLVLCRLTKYILESRCPETFPVLDPVMDDDDADHPHRLDMAHVTTTTTKTVDEKHIDVISSSSIYRFIDFEIDWGSGHVDPATQVTFDDERAYQSTTHEPELTMDSECTCKSRSWDDDVTGAALVAALDRPVCKRRFLSSFYRPSDLSNMLDLRHRHVENAEYLDQWIQECKYNRQEAIDLMVFSHRWVHRKLTIFRALEREQSEHGSIPVLMRVKSLTDSGLAMWPEWPVPLSCRLSLVAVDNDDNTTTASTCQAFAGSMFCKRLHSTFRANLVEDVTLQTRMSLGLGENRLVRIQIPGGGAPGAAEWIINTNTWTSESVHPHNDVARVALIMMIDFQRLVKTGRHVSTFLSHHFESCAGLVAIARSYVTTF